MNKKLISIFVVVLFMAIGFAAAVINLSFAGTSKVAFDEADFNIFFSKVSDGDKLLNTISADGDSFTFTSDGTSMVTYYIINRSVNYNAIISVSCDKSVVINQESDAILAGTVVSGTVASSYVGDVTCTLNSLPTPREQQNKNDAIKVTLDGQGASLDVTEFYVVNDFPVGALPIPELEGKTLYGWFTSTEEDATKITASTIADFTGDITLYAQWVDNVVVSEPGESEFVIPRDGKYQIEVWGAQGGSLPGADGGKGGYSVGTIEATADTTLYLTVGGKGETDGVGGYNGGGAGNESYAGGGGATHVALEPGLLKDIAVNKVLLVAGGGGGSGEENSTTFEAPSSTYTPEDSRTVCSCDPNGVLSGGQCTYTTNTFNEAYYSSGYYYCSGSGWTRSGTSCSKTVTTSTAATYHAAGYSCPNGGTLSGTKCTKSETTTTAATKKTSTSCTDCREYKCAGWLSETQCGGYYCSDCRATSTTTSYVCPSGYTASGSGANTTCSKTTTSSYTATYTAEYYTCSEGTLSGSSCVTSSTQTKSASYSSGYYYCGSGTLQSDNTCLVKTQSQSLATCKTTYAEAAGGSGGGLVGVTKAGSSAGTQSSGALFGAGGDSTTGGGGGAGYYGGTGNEDIGGGSGGSGYVSSILTSSRTYDGDSIFLSPNGTKETGHKGDGYIKITVIPYSN